MQDDMNELLDKIKALIKENQALEIKLIQMKCGCITGCPDCTMPCNSGADLYD